LCPSRSSIFPYTTLFRSGLIDTAAELARLEKAIDKAQKEFDLFNRKLSNENFVSKAPADVIAKEREKLSAAEETLTQLKLQYNRSEEHTSELQSRENLVC